MIEVLAPYGALIVYALTAVAAVATIKAAAVSLKERLDSHEKQDRETHEKLFTGQNSQNVLLARLEEKVDSLRSDVQGLK